MGKSVIPLESNPGIFSALAAKLGLSSVLEFDDIFSITDPDIMAFNKSPMYGVILLLPITAKFEEYRKEEALTLQPPPSDVRWFKQTMGNACGLYALLHILSNVSSDLIIKNSLLGNFLNELKSLNTTDEISNSVEKLEELIQLDQNFGGEGQTEAPPAGSETILHFITFVVLDGHLYELDGRRNGPIDLGIAKDLNVLADDRVAKKFERYVEMADEENKNNFALMGLAA